MLSRRYLMKEASIWRYALAQQLASHYCANPKVAAVIVEGSVTRGYADRSSDIDLAVFWTEPPAEKERRDIIKLAGGRRWQIFPYNREEACWSEEFEVTAVTIDVLHVGVEATELILSEILERCDPSLTIQQHMSALRSALPLSDLSD